jgi:hypothetical protein
VRASAVFGFQVGGVRKEAQGFVAVIGEAEEGADADVVEPCAKSAVLREQAMVVVALRATDVHALEGGAVVGLLEEGVGADFVGRFQTAHVAHRQRRDLDVEAPDAAARVGLDAADDVQGVEELVKGVFWVLSGQNQKAAVALALQRFDFRD